MHVIFKQEHSSYRGTDWVQGGSLHWHLPGRYSATALHAELNIDRLDTTRKKMCSADIYKYVNGKSLQTLCDIFARKQDPRLLNCDSEIKLNIPVTRTVIG